MRFRVGAGLPVICLLLLPSLAAAQQKAAASFAEESSVKPESGPAAWSQDPQEPEPKPEDQMGTSGFFLGIIGMLAGAAIGSQVGQGDCPSRDVDKDCVSRHAYTGALVAGTLMVPVGVHIASKTRGSLLASLGLSIATGGLSYYGFKAVPGSPIAMAPFVAAPIQVFTSIKVER